MSVPKSHVLATVLILELTTFADAASRARQRSQPVPRAMCRHNLSVNDGSPLRSLGASNRKATRPAQWRANGTVPIRPREMHERTYQRVLSELAYHEAIRKQGAGYAQKYRPDQHRAQLWRQCRSRFAQLGGWPNRMMAVE
jgi:hypothetical protein